MGKRDPRVDAYIAKSADFAKPILERLREVVHQGCPEVVEEMKWSFPHFSYKGMFCGMAAFKKHATFGFWKHALLVERVKGLPRLGADAMGQFGRLTSLDDLPRKSTLLKVVKEAAVAVPRGECYYKFPRFFASEVADDLPQPFPRRRHSGRNAPRVRL